MTKLNQLADLGQAIWIDFIRRSFMLSGEMQTLVDQGLRGMTSNPTIFDKAIAGSSDYDDALAKLAQEGKSVTEIYESLAVTDIRMAADALRPVFEHSRGVDGYVSLEVSPTLAHDTQGTLEEAQRLFKLLDRPNIMIKIPATPEGIPAIEGAISKGININVTLIFSVAHYEAAAQAYIAGLEKWAASGGDIARPASVASFFVSRVDTLVDRVLIERENEDLLGKIAIANAKVAYARFKEIIASPRWQRLAAQGARPQRPLWASTSTKNPAYPDTLYVDNLIGPHTVNTLPPDALEAFMDHGVAALTLEDGLERAHAHLKRLEDLGIHLDTLTQKLQDDGVTSFAHSFESLMESIAKKKES